jgi:hypothetical protein
MLADDLETAALAVFESIPGGPAMPGAEGRAYDLVFASRAHADAFTLALDMLNVDPANAPGGVLELRRVSVGELSRPADGVVVQELDFRADARGWSLKTIPVFGAPVGSVTPRGLALNGGSAGMGIVFGFWEQPLEQAVIVEGGALYEIAWTLSSDAPDADFSRLPTARLRVNAGAAAAALVTIDPAEDPLLAPTENQSRIIRGYFVAPPDLAGERLRLSFDYLAVLDDGADDPALSLFLENVTVTRHAAVQEPTDAE